MLFRFSGAVLVEYPENRDERPIMRPTFMFSGVSVTFSEAPTTAADMTVSFVTDGADQLVVKVDPSEEALTSWLHNVAEGPIACPLDMYVKVEYANDDARDVRVLMLGYWK